MPPPLPDFLEMLKALIDHQVDFIVVGGVCAVLQGAPYNTFDLDVVHSRVPENLDRLVEALQSIDAHYRFHSQRIVPTASHLASPGHHLLTTAFGPLDVLGTLVEDLGYPELESFAEWFALELGQEVRVLSLEKLIEIKEKTGRPKDQIMLGVLRETLREKRQRGTETPPAQGD